MVLGIIAEAIEGGARALSRIARENLIRSTLPGVLEQGYSRTRAYEMYRDAGLGIRRSDFFELSRDVEGIEARAQRIRYVRPDFVPTESVLETARVPLPERYRFVVEMDILNPTTGVLEKGHMAMDTSVLNTRAEIEADVVDAFKSAYPEYEQRVQSVRIVRGYIAA